VLTAVTLRTLHGLRTPPPVIPSVAV
jgi:hypothetical protein